MTHRNIFIQSALAVMLTTLLTSSVIAQETFIEKVIASINDEVVLSSELDERVLEIMRRFEGSDQKIPSKDEVESQVLEQLIIERIQLLKAKQAGIRYSDEEVNSAIETTAKRQNKTMEELLEEGEKGGLTPAKFRQKVREQLLIGRVQEGNLNKRISISDQAIDNFLNTEEGRSWATPDVQLGHILLLVPSDSSKEKATEVQEKILDLYFQVKNGKDFRATAIAESQGQKSFNGGDMGWKKPSQLPELFVAAIENISPGQISEPIRSDAGFHLIKLYNRRGGVSENLVQQHNVQHILLTPNEIRNDKATLALLSKLRAEVLDGEHFNDIARIHSEDIGTAMSGGSLGWSVPGQFVGEFEKIMKAMNIGEISEPFKTQFGWHLLQVTERRKQDFSNTIKRSQARNTLKQKRFKEELELWLKEVRDEAFVDIKL